MAVGIVDRQKLVNIADAVRAKKGITGNMTLDAIASNITSMPISDNNAKYDFSKSGIKSSGDLLSYLTTVDLTGLDTSRYTNMSRMFYNYPSLTSLDLSSFNTSKVTNMSSMFIYCHSLTTLNVSNWNTTNVTHMSSIFAGCRSLTSLDVSSFNTSKVTDMNNMFEGCSSLTSLDVSNFDTSKVTTMNNMFASCSSLTSLDVSNFDTSKVNSMPSMFSNCRKLSNLTLGTDWASNLSIKSFDLSSCPLTRESALDVIHKLAPRINPVAPSNSPVIKFSNQVGLYQSEIDVANNKGWSVSGCVVLVEDPNTATVGQGAIIDGVPSKCVYVADTPQAWGQRIFGSLLKFIDSKGNLEYQWGGYGTATGITETAIGTGLTNTNALLAMNLQSTDGTPTIWDALAEFRSTYGDRWFIPSRDEGSNYDDDETDAFTSSEYDSDLVYINVGNAKTYEGKKSSSCSFAPFTYV